jgi:spore coat protein H
MKQKQNRLLSLLLVTILLGTLGAGCAPAQSAQSAATSAPRGSTNSAGSHGKTSDPNYEVVFPQESVNRMEITLTRQAWSALQEEMSKQFGQQGSQSSQGRGNRGGNNPGRAPGGNGQGPGGGGGLNFGDTSYVSSTIQFNGETWNSVGFRYSGNSTLANSWRSGTQKISFRLDFDQFADTDKATKNQRFYGFKQMAFKSGAMDGSYLREKLTADIFRAAGVAASKTAFYEVYVDYGEGQKYFGLYTAVEVVDDTLIKTQFSDGSGNVYKPEGSGAAFVQGSFSEGSFEKQTNQKAADWSDIQAVFAALHSDLRTTDPAAWRAGLEKVFDVDAFLRWLAADTIIQNWDTYGTMAHNYYLYTNPGTGKVTWIPWDNNEALNAKRGGGPGGQGGGVRALDLSTVSERWPLIRYLADDPVYLAKYKQNLKEIIQTAFQPDALAATYQKYHDLIAPSVQKETSGYTQLKSLDGFNSSVAGLVQQAKERSAAVMEYLAK